jgi:tRNA1Val (adenine37-N6)-methyltransferase
MAIQGTLSRDRFLDGRLVIAQPRGGYRAGTDPVLLAAAVPAVGGQAVLELGCGVGVASFCLGVRVPGLALHGVERQPDYADLARQNAAANAVALDVTIADLTRMPSDLLARTFDHVIANPPYFDAASGTGARDPGREAALREVTPLADWIDAALRRLRPGGWLTLIQRADRMPEVLGAIGRRAGQTAVLPLTGRAGQPAGRVIVRARKGGKGPFRLLAPFVLHDGPCHTGDGDDYGPAARAVLRDGRALPVGSAASRRKGAGQE